VRCGIFLPIFDDLADPGLLAGLAADAEAAGWDGVFLWDHVYYRPPVRAVTDPWIALAAMAIATTSVVLGPMVTPLARRRPQILARQVAAIEQLAPERFVLGVGLGLDASGHELSRFGEEADDRHRAVMFDEALPLVIDLLSGEPVDHRGAHFTAADVRFLPAPARRVPVWVAARWPNRRPIERALRHDGVFIIDIDDPTALALVVADIRSRRAGSLDDYEVVVTSRDRYAATSWAAAGATWWLAGFDPFTVTADDVRAVIRVGPPR
jgi:alkanesulfonate monooxygenase SsuD/methylene tetrahydromethanopterin reductase-like flavin-dependent oxidoreductase (luciferase family)